MSYEIAIPYILLETLQIAFQKEAKKICREVANTVGLDPTDVYQKVCKNSKIQIYDLDVPAECPRLYKNGSIYSRCSRPCVLGTGKCLSHQNTIQKEPEVEKTVNRLIGTDEPLWVQDSNVLNLNGENVGHFQDGQLFRYK
jgi:hypothetical protein